MLKKCFSSFVIAGLLACSGLASASEPVVLSDGTLDILSAGNTLAPPSLALAWAYTSATSSPYFQIIIETGYAANTGTKPYASAWLDVRSDVVGL